MHWYKSRKFDHLYAALFHDALHHWPPNPPSLPHQKNKRRKGFTTHKKKNAILPQTLHKFHYKSWQCNFLPEAEETESALKSGKRITRQTMRGCLYFMLLRVWEKESSPLLLYLSGIFLGTTSSCCVCWCFSKSLHNVVSQPHPNQ